MPFVLSLLIITYFAMVQLKESAQAPGDALLYEFQDLTRMNPFELLKDERKKALIYDLASF